MIRSMDAQVLKDLPLFAELDDEQLRRVATFAAVTEVGAGAHLVDEGDFSYELMVIREGEARVVRGGEELARLGPGDIIGEIGVLARELRSATVIADTTMRLVTLSHWDVRRLSRSEPQLVERIRSVAAERLDRAQ
jgi:CRP-like cAMP-binding protein